MDAERLKGIDALSGLDDDELRRVATFASEKTVDAGEELVREGDYAYEMFAIEDGSVEVRQGDEVLATLGAGEVFGETGVLEREQRNATVVATTPVRAIVLAHYDVKRLRKAMPELADKLSALLDERAPR
jgi:CRP-like cAMP-binding protein